MRLRLSTYSWGVLGYTILVILWGAFVRASGSGAGCGNHWPSCNGAIVPLPEQIETVIEFTHRAMTGILLPLFAILLVWIFRSFPSSHRERRAVVAAGILLIIESLIGAGLVRLELVANNASAGRAVAVALHLTNTYLLLAALTLTAWWSQPEKQNDANLTGRTDWRIMGVLGGMLLLGATGAITALGDTLFPAESLSTGLAQDLSPTANFLVRLRVWHPLLAILVSVYTIEVVRRKNNGQAGDERATRLRRLVIVLIGAQLTIGVINIALLAPIWVQLLHLLTADLLWILVVIYASELRETAQPVRAVADIPLGDLT